MAISIDGLITRGTTDSDWVSKSDWDQFYSYINSNDVVIMGRRTMEQFGENFPIEGPMNIVLSSNTDLQKQDEKLIIMGGSPSDVVDMAKKKGFENLLLIGGSETNKQFLKAGLIDEIVLSVHPLVIGSGLKIFGEESLDVKLDLLGTKEINKELVQIRYKVIKQTKAF